MTDPECVVCTRSASLLCESCVTLDEAGAPIDVRWYCTPLCQDLDRLNHNERCTSMANDKNFLLRATQAGEAVQALFYSFIEHSWAYDMSGVCVTPGSNGEMLTIEVDHGSDTGPNGEHACERIGGGWLVKFPHLKSANRKVKRALLADRHSVWMFVVMHVAVQLLFKDLIDNAETDIKEIVHYLPRHCWRIVKHRADDRLLVRDREDLPYPDEDLYGALKGVYRITLKNGTKIALDLAGAQYNPTHDTVMPWTEYLHRWVNDIKYRLPLRSHYKKHGENMANLHSESHLDVIIEQLACFNGLLQNCEFELGFNLKDLHSENIGYFRDCKHRLIVAAEDRLLRRPRDLDSELAATSKNKLENPMTDELECIPGYIGDMKYFDWSKLVDMIKMPSNKVTWKEKRKAKMLLRFRCAYKMPGDWRLMFCESSLPSMLVPREFISENPFFGKRK